MRNIDWDDLRFFLAVTAAGSLSAAARELGVNTTTVLRRVGGLEDALGARLFDRLRSGYTPTADGARLLESLEPVDRCLSSLQRDFRAGASQGGDVRIGASETIAAALIAPALQRFHEMRDDIILDIVADPNQTGASAAPRILDPLRDVDIALRLARPTQGDMLARKLGDVAYGLYAAEDYVATHGEVPPDGDLSGHRVIGFGEDARPLGPVWWMARTADTATIVMRASNATTRLNAVRAGLGVAALPCIAADGAAGIVRLVAPAHVGALELWLLARRDLAQLAHVRAVMDFLIAEVKARGGDLSGAAAA